MGPKWSLGSTRFGRVSVPLHFVVKTRLVLVLDRLRGRAAER
jgi:hypothetical protein